MRSLTFDDVFATLTAVQLSAADLISMRYMYFGVKVRNPGRYPIYTDRWRQQFLH